MATLTAIPNRLRIGELIQMRWCALAGQLAVFLIAVHGLGLQLLWTPLLVVLLVGVASNCLLAVQSKRHALSPRSIGAVLLFDTITLTVLLSFYGGHSNPFSLFYLVHVVLAAFLLGVEWMWCVLAASALGYTLQFFVFVPIHALHQHGEVGTDLHLKGMLVAFVLVAMLLGYFVSRMLLALEAAREEIRMLEQQAHLDEKLVALSTLSAGAAHELRTPLATVKLIVDEMARGAAEGRDGISQAEDLALLQRELFRCETILNGMAGISGDIAGEMPSQCVLKELISGVYEELVPEQRARLKVQGVDDTPLVVPVLSIQRMLLSLLRNAFDASSPSEAVQLVAKHIQGELEITIQDQGAGMTESVLARVGEPFFSTKPIGSGMGLGVFLVKSFLRVCGGTFSLQSREGFGTKATVRFPAVIRFAEAA